jgi:hypoxanthine-DNA glycosylase
MEEKKQLLLSNNIALWDVIKSCDIVGSSDSSIKNAVPNDFTEIFEKADIKAVYTNGSTAYNLYKKYCKNDFEAIRLPSTSPANAAYSLDKLINEWKIIR